MAIGAGWAGNLKTASFKGEVIYSHPQDNFGDTSGSVTASITSYYVFKGKVYVMAGIMYGSVGLDKSISPAALAGTSIGSTAPPSAKNLTPTKYNILASVYKPISPFLRKLLCLITAAIFAIMELPFLPDLNGGSSLRELD